MKRRGLVFISVFIVIFMLNVACSQHVSDDMTPVSDDITSIILCKIEIINLPVRTIYWIGDIWADIDLTGIEVIAHYDNATVSQIPITIKNISGFDSSTTGDKKLTVTYQDKTDSFTISIIESPINKIRITKLPAKTTYYAGDTLTDTDLEGLEVFAYCENGVYFPVTITTDHISGFDSAINGEKTLTVTYKDKTAEFTVNVNTAVVMIGIRITSVPFKKNYKFGEELNTTGLVVENEFSNGSTQTTDKYYISGDTLSVGTVCITVVSTLDASKTASFNIYVSNELIYTGLPALRIDTSGREINSTEIWLGGATYTLYNSSGTMLSSGSMDIKGRGNTTWVMPKKPYSLKLTDSASLLGIPSHKRWALLANYSDKTLLRTEAAFKLGGIFDNLAWTPRSEQVDVYLNNQYCGVYQLTEAIKIDANRVNINKIKSSAPNDGYILEIDYRRGEKFNFTTTRGVVFCCSDPDENLDEIIPGENRTLFEKIREDVRKAENVLYSAGFADPETGYRQYLDVDSFIDWYLVNEITKNNDAIFFSSVYMYYDPAKQKYCMGPIWDFDISLGNVDYNGNDNSEGFWIKNSAWISRLFADPVFVAQVKSRWNEKKTEVDGILQFMDSRTVFISNAASYNFRRWPILDQYVWPNPVVTGSYSGEITYLKSWLSERLYWLDGAINGLN